MAKARFILTNFAVIVVGLVIVIIGSLTSSNPDLLYKPASLLTSLTGTFGYIQTISGVSLSALFKSVTAILIVAGLCHVILGVLGLVGGLKGNPYLLILYSTCALVMVAMEVGLSVYVYMWSDVVQTKIVDTLAISITKDYMTGFRVTNVSDISPPTNTKELSLDQLQLSMQCCGSSSPEDWAESAKWNRTYVLEATVITAQVPISCCLRTPSGQIESTILYLSTSDFLGLKECLVQTKTTPGGCEYVIMEFLTSLQMTVGCCFIFAVLLQGLSVLVGCCMRAVSDKPNIIRPI